MKRTDQLEESQLHSCSVNMAPHSKEIHLGDQDAQISSREHFSSPLVLDCESVDRGQSRRFVMHVLPSIGSERESKNQSEHTVQRKLLQSLAIKDEAVDEGDENKKLVTATGVARAASHVEVVDDSTFPNRTKWDDPANVSPPSVEGTARALAVHQSNSGAHLKTKEVPASLSRTELSGVFVAHSHVSPLASTQTRSLVESSSQIPCCAPVAATPCALYHITNAPSFALVSRDEVSSLYTATPLQSQLSSPSQLSSLSSASYNVDNSRAGEEYYCSDGAFGYSCNSSTRINGASSGE